MFVILLLPKLIASKNMLIETEDSVDANDRKVSKDVHGKDYDHYDQDIMKETPVFFSHRYIERIQILVRYKFISWCSTSLLQEMGQKVVSKGSFPK